MSFGKSFDEAFKPAMAQSQAGAFDAIKEKIKKDTEKAKADSKLAAIKGGIAKMREDMALAGQDTSSIDPFVQGISELKDADVAELFAKSALSTAEKQKSMADQIIELSKVAEAGKTLGNRNLFESASGAANKLLGGNNGTPSNNIQVGNIESSSVGSGQAQPQPTQDQKLQIQQAQQGPMSSNINLQGIGSIEIDSFTGKETAEGHRQKVANSLIEERAKKSLEPLGSEVVSKYAGSVQGLSMIQKTVENLGFYRDADTGKVKTTDNTFSKKIAGSKAASFQETTLPFSNIKVTGGIFEGLVQMAGSDDARKIDLWLETLAEDILRARTGAAAPEPERIREEQRSLIRLLDSPDVAFERLTVNEDFMRTVVNQIRPGTVNPLELPTGVIKTDKNGNRALLSKDLKRIIKEL